MSQEATQHKIYAGNITVECPDQGCEEMVDCYRDPRGEKVFCPKCHTHFVVASDAQIVLD